MARQPLPIVLDADPLVPLNLRIPASLHRTVHLYCVFRGHDESKIGLAAAGAIEAYFASDGAFQAWRREHPEVPVTLPQSAPRRSRRRREQHPQHHPQGS